jgi:sugar phosphate isomerase/epimerase
MRLGLGSYARAWAIGVPGFAASAAPLDSIGLIRHAADLGLRLVQIADNLPLELASDATLAAIRKTAVSAGVAIELGTRGIDPGHLRRMLALCGEFSCSLLRVVVDTASQRPSPGEVVQTLGELVPQFERAKVVLAIENHDRFPARSLAEIVESIGSPYVGICLDTVNSFGCLEGPGHVVSHLAPFVVSLHVKDFTIRRAPHMMGFEISGVPAGQGMLDVPWLIETLRNAGRDPNAILELWPSPEDTVAATVAKEEEWVRASVRYLRTLIAA